MEMRDIDRQIMVLKELIRHPPPISILTLSDSTSPKR
jgi:predicted transcriptional regulator